MRVALDGHEVDDLDRSGNRDAPELVAPEVDEHEVFGALLLVGEQVVGQGAVLAFRCAPRARPGDGPEARGAAFELDHRLGGGADEGASLETEVVEVRRGVHEALHAVERDGVARRLRHEALRRHALDEVAFDDALLDLADDSLEVVGGVRGAERAEILARGVRRGGGFGERFQQLSDAPARGGEGLGGGGGVAGECEAHDEERLLDIVEDEH